MKKVIPFFLLLSSTLFSQVKVVSCNLENFGQSKSAESMNYITIILKTYRIVAIQAVAKLANEQNRKGVQWDYILYEKP